MRQNQLIKTKRNVYCTFHAISSPILCWFSLLFCNFAGKNQILCITFGQTRVILQVNIMPISMVAYLYSRCITKRCSNDYLLLLKTSQRKRSLRNIIKQKQPRTTYTSELRQRSLSVAKDLFLVAKLQLFLETPKDFLEKVFYIKYNDWLYCSRNHFLWAIIPSLLFYDSPPHQTSH